MRAWGTVVLNKERARQIAAQLTALQQDLLHIGDEEVGGDAYVVQLALLPLGSLPPEPQAPPRPR